MTAEHRSSPYRGHRLVRREALPMAVIPLVPNERLLDLDITLGAAGVLLEGRVLDNGSPIPRAWVSWLRRGPEYEPQGRFAADAEGRFALRVPPGPVLLEASAEGYVSRIVEVPAPGPFVELALSPGGTIEGVALSQDTQTPVPNVRAHARPQSAPLFAGWNGLQSATLTDAKGHFMLTGLGAGRYVVEVTGDGWFGESDPVVVSLEVKASTVIHLLRGALVQGTVLERMTGKPCLEGNVKLTADPEDLGRSFQSPVSVSGHFSFDAVPPGRYAVDPECPGLVAPGTRVRLAIEGQRAPPPLRIELDSGLTVRGTVIRSTGRPAGGIRIEASPQDAAEAPTGSAREFFALSDDNGSFTLLGLQRGRWTFTPVSSDRLPLGTSISIFLGVVSPESPRLTLFPSASVAIRLKGANGWVSDARVMLQSDEAGVRETRFDGEVFLANDLPPGRYRVDARGPRGEPLVAEKSTPELVVFEEQQFRRDIVVDPLGLTIWGQVVDEDQQPVSEAVVHAEWEGPDRDSAELPNTFTGIQGEFTLLGVGRGPYVITAQHGDGRSGRLSGVRSGQRVQVTLQAAAPGPGSPQSAK